MTAARALQPAAWAAALVGAAFRLAGFGRHGFWNDEAWVAIASRVECVQQFLLALGVTPIAWGAMLLPLAGAPAPPEVALRLLPLGFGLVTLSLAWRLGARLAGHALGGLGALVLVAFDPTGIAWSQQLKHYTAEAALALWAFLAADAVVRRGRNADIAVLALVLTLGVTVSNAQLLLAPPLVAALLGEALMRPDRALLGRIALAGSAVALWNLAWFTLVIHPWVTPALREFWRGHYAPLDSASALGAFVYRSGARLLAPALGSDGVLLALGALAVLLTTHRARWAAVSMVLLVVELAAISGAGMFPLDVPRTALFATTLLLVATGAAAALLVAWSWTRPSLRPLAVTVAVAFGLVVARGHWPPLSERVPPEDLGPLLRVMERDRRAGDRVLIYGRSLFVWGYYRSGTPVLVPAPGLANGFLVLVDDPDAVLLPPDDLEGPVAHAFAGAARVWFVGSRFRSGDEVRIRAVLGRRGRVVHDERRERALLLLVEPP